MELAALSLFFAIAAAVGFSAWLHERRKALRRAALEEKRRGEMAERERSQTEDLRKKLTAEQHLRLRSERARRAEREWTRELREQVLNMYRSRGAGGNLQELVLQVSIALSGAEKGLLLSQRDQDGDGKLDLVCHLGFDRDPSDSGVAQRFAERVIEREEIVREDQPGDGSARVDEEIDTLVAVPVYIRDDFHGVVVCANRPGGFEELDDDVLLALGDHAGAVLENHSLHGRLRASYLAVVRVMADAIEAKDPFARAGSDEVSAAIEAVVRRLGLDHQATERLVFAGLLRDVGKLGISDRVLLKPGPLNADERKIAQLHPLIGARIVERIPGLAELSPDIRHHHERWDGGGYPGALASDAIPLGARVLAVADAYTAMTTTRPYRRVVTREEACREIERCAGSQFDPEVARLFAEEIRRAPDGRPDDGSLAEALDVTAVQAHRERGEPLLGHGSVASTDHVTLLYSHRHLHEVAEAEAARAQRHQRPFAVVIAELPNLAEINRREGYAAGDRALTELARAIEGCLAGVPSTAGRFSGRRLAVVLPGAGQQRATAVAERIERSFDGSGPVPRTAVAVWQHGDHGSEVLGRARRALSAGTALLS